MRPAETERLLRHVIALRRHELDGAPEVLGDVRDDLERMVGPPVSRALAARILGVSQTALDRHVRAGAVPVVMTPDGRRGITVSELVRLAVEVEHERERGQRHPLAAVLRAQAQTAGQVPLLRLVEPDGSVPRGHRPAELRGLAYHRAIADGLDKQMLSDARRRLRRWRDNGSIHPDRAREWEGVLTLPVEEVRQVIVADDQRGRDLRQSSPFAGTFIEPVRRRLMGLVPVHA